MVERALGSEPDPDKRDRARNTVKLGWCYGGLEGEMFSDWMGTTAGSTILRSTNHFAPLVQKNPYLLSVPRGPGWDLLESRGKAAKKPQSRLELPGGRRLERLRGTSAAPPRLDDPTLVAQMDEAMRKRILASMQNMQPVQITFPWDNAYFSKSGWLSCGGFQYSDAVWQRSVPEPAPPAPPSASAASARASGGGTSLSVPPGAEKAQDIMEKIKELGGPILSFALQFLRPRAPTWSRTSPTRRRTSSASGRRRWWTSASAPGTPRRRRSSRSSRGRWPRTRSSRRRGAGVDQAREKLHQAEVAAAAAVGPAKEKAQDKVNAAKDAFEAAGKELQQRTAELAAKTKEAASAVKQVCKEHEEIKGSGDLLGSLFEKLNTFIMGRVTQVLEPNVRHLVTFGMKFLRGILGPIVASVIGALGSIPFVGGALAPIGEVAYDLAMNALEDAAIRGLMGVVEKLLSSLLRAALTPVFNAVKSSVLATALNGFSNALGSVCGGRRAGDEVQRAAAARPLARASARLLGVARPARLDPERGSRGQGPDPAQGPRDAARRAPLRAARWPTATWPGTGSATTPGWRRWAPARRRRSWRARPRSGGVSSARRTSCARACARQVAERPLIERSPRMNEETPGGSALIAYEEGLLGGVAP